VQPDRPYEPQAPLAEVIGIGPEIQGTLRRDGIAHRRTSVDTSALAAMASVAGRARGTWGVNLGREPVGPSVEVVIEAAGLPDALAAFDAWISDADRRTRDLIVDRSFTLGEFFLVEPDGRFRTLADDLGAPNGPALTDDGGTVVLAEGAAWVADPIGGRVVRLRAASELTHAIDYSDDAPGRMGARRPGSADVVHLCRPRVPAGGGPAGAVGSDRRGSGRGGRRGPPVARAVVERPSWNLNAYAC
jgi:hypothetical protein